MFDSMRKALKDVGLSSGVKQGSATAGGRPSDLSGATLSVAGRHWLVEEMFAEGGMARVYKARELSTSTRVAMKQMLVPADRQDAQSEAEREADLHARLSDHPNVVTLFSRDVSRAEAHRPELPDPERDPPHSKWACPRPARGEGAHGPPPRPVPN